MGSKRKVRRRQHGSAWHWKQTDAWYYTLPGSKQRRPLFDEQGRRIKGRERREEAEAALAKLKPTLGMETTSLTAGGECLVAEVCSDYLQYCERKAAAGVLSAGHLCNASRWLNDLCSYCGALPVVSLKKGHVTAWLESHTSWRSSNTRRFQSSWRRLIAPTKCTAFPIRYEA